MSTFDDDDALQQALAEALAEGEQAPPSFARHGRDLFVWRTVDAELLALVSDSADEDSGALVRGLTATRSLTFSSTAWTVEVDLERDPDVLRGQVLPAVPDGPVPAEAKLERPGLPPAVVTVDDLGYFVVQPYAADGPFRLRLGDVVTAWTT